MTAQHDRVRGDVADLVPADGLGVRLGPGAPKALRKVAGASLLSHALERLVGAPSVGCLVIAAPPGHTALVAAELPEAPAVRLLIVEGGATRQASVAAALAAVPEGFPIILVHDAARAFVPPELVERVAAAVRSGQDAVVPVLPVVDTIKQVDADGYVTGTPSRASLRAVQTPQGFRRAVLERAHVAADRDADAATDDAALVERLGVRVWCVPGSEAALKITRPDDLRTAELLAASPDPVNP